MNKYAVRSYGTATSLQSIKSDWNTLHSNCIQPSIYNSFDFIHDSIDTFKDEGVKIMILTFTEVNTHELIAIFPFQISSYPFLMSNINAIEYTALDEIDKPYPIIKQGCFEKSWNLLFVHLKTITNQWQLLDLIEVREDFKSIKYTKSLCKNNGMLFLEKPDKEGPIITLQGEWNYFWSNHKKMRKKIHKIENVFGDRLKFQVYHSDVQWCLDEYINLEQRSWKKDKIGISKNINTYDFYHKLFRNLSETDSLYFGFLSIDDLIISGEISYVLEDKVYFSHGCYDDKYKKYSPGMISTSYFIKHFYGNKFSTGDFLCGYAGYLNAWSDSILNTKHISIYNSTIKARYIIALKMVNKFMITPIKKVLLGIHGSFNISK